MIEQTCALVTVFEGAVGCDRMTDQGSVRFEWDPRKAKRNLKKHSAGEYHYITVGLSFRDRLLVVAHAERGESLGIISARPATVYERTRHEG